MPGLPRPRLARLLRRRNADDARRASTVLIVGALLALGLAWDGSTRAALVVAIVAIVTIGAMAPDSGRSPICWTACRR